MKLNHISFSTTNHVAMATFYTQVLDFELFKSRTQGLGQGSSI